MADFKLLASGDIDLSTGDLQIVDGIAGKAQEVAMLYRTRLGESKYARNRGLSYEVLFDPNVSRAAKESYLKSLVFDDEIGIEGAIEWVAFSLAEDALTRRGRVTGKLRFDEGVVALDEEI